MGVIDIILIVYFILMIILGAKRAAFHGVLSIINLLLVFIVTYFLSHFLSEYLGWEENTYKLALLIAGTFFVILLIDGILIGSFINAFGKVEKAGALSRIIGGLIGPVKGVLYAGMLLWGVLAVAPGSNLAFSVINGTVSGKVVQATVIAYEHLDALISKNGITPSSILEYKIDIQ